MPVTPQKCASAPTTRQSLLLLLLLLVSVLMLMPRASATAYATADEEPTPDQYDLDELLHTETVLIDALRRYIETLTAKINTIKKKTLEIKAIHDVAIIDMDKYLNNPLNSLTIIKRFTSDWNVLRRYARNVNSTTEIVQNLNAVKASLKFPSETDFDEAASNLLRIQGIYNLEPERLAVGEVNGIKLGAEMSWSDCLEIGRVSVQNGDFMIAKFWMEAALGKLPAETNATAEQILMPMTTTSSMTTTTTTTTKHESEKARFEIWDAMMNAEYKMGNFETALDIVNKMLELHPKHKGVLMAKEVIENEIKQLHEQNVQQIYKENKIQKKQSDKSIEELLIEEICRDATSPSNTSQYVSSARHCALVGGNLPQLLWQPLKVEYLSLEPYIVIHHDVLRSKEVTELQHYLDESYDELEEESVLEDLRFTQIGQKKLRKITNRLQWVTGHASALFAEWKADRWTFEDDVEAETLLPQSSRNVANVLFNVQPAKLGGAIVFPQLEFGVRVPQNALLYWANLNEFHEYDYRTKQHVCPVIAGTQISAFTTIKSA